MHIVKSLSKYRFKYLFAAYCTSLALVTYGACLKTGHQRFSTIILLLGMAISIKIFITLIYKYMFNFRGTHPLCDAQKRGESEKLNPPAQYKKQ